MNYFVLLENERNAKGVLLRPEKMFTGTKSDFF